MKTKTKKKTVKAQVKRTPKPPKVQIQPQEYEKIVEFSYNTKTNSYVVRFLSGESYALNIDDLPGKIQLKRPDWQTAHLSPSGSSLVVNIKRKKPVEILAHIIHSRGRLIK